MEEKPVSPRIRLDNYRADFDRGAPRWKEGLWVACKCLFFLPPWPVPSPFRAWMLRRFGAKIGQGLVIRSGVNIAQPWRLSMGEHVWLGEEVRILNLAPVRIGSHSCVSQRAFLCAASHDFGSAGFELILQPIDVGAHCWIAAQAFIGPGVSIGDGALVAAGSVVVEDVPEDAMAAGNPAVVKRILHRP